MSYHEYGDWLETPLHHTGTDPVGWVPSSQVYVLDKKPNSEYILDGSDSGFFTSGIVDGFSAFECRLARNEIYARHGKIFKDEALQIYFNNCTWYTPQYDDVSDSMLNEWELANIDMIVNYEKSMGYR